MARWAAVFGGIAVAALAGCGAVQAGTEAGVSAPTPTPSPTSALQLIVVDFLTVEDDQAVMSDQQRATLRAILVADHVDYEQYSAAVAATIACAEEAGLRVDGPRPAEIAGQPALVWGWSDPTMPDGDPTLGEYCRVTHSIGIEQAYLNTDVAIEDERRQLEVFRVPLIECLESHGVVVDDRAMDIYVLLDLSNQASLEPGWDGQDCQAEVNVSVGS